MLASNLVVSSGVVTSIQLDRPPVNAVNQHMYEELIDVFGRFDELFPDAKVVIVSSTGSHFCAGNELSEFASLSESNSPGRMRVVRSAFAAIYDCPVPVIAAVRGAVLGTGLCIAGSCDVIVASESARFGTPEVSIGVMGGARHLARLVPGPVVRRMYLTGEPAPAAELLSYGSVAAVVRDEELMDTAAHMAQLMARHSRAALRSAKESLNMIEFADLKGGYEFEQRMTSRLVGHPDAREALMAFIERRPPSYLDVTPNFISSKDGS